MARRDLILPPDEMVPTAPWGSLAGRVRPPAVGNASPAEQPGRSAEEYAQAAAIEKQAGNEDAAARLAVRASETRAQEFAGAGTPEPTSPLPQVAPASQAKRPTLSDGEQLQAPMLAEASPWSALASYQAPERSGRGDMSAPQLYQPLEEPPEYEAPSVGGNLFALGLDALFNKGRNAGRIVSRIADGEGDSRYANWKRKADAARAAADLEATKRRGTLTPEEQAYRDARLEIARAGLGLRGEQIEAQGESLKLRKEQEAVKNDPTHAGAERFRKQLEAEGAIRPGQWDGMSWEQMKAAGNEALKNRVDIAMADEINKVAAEKANAVANATDDNKVRVAGGIAEVTQPYKRELAEIGATTAAGARAETQAINEANRVTDFKTKFAENAAEELTIASMMDRVDQLGGASPAELAERLPDVLASWGISSPERMEAWQGKKMILEKWGRSQSGAAISLSEDDKFKIQAASRGDASPAQIEAAWKIMERTIATRLKTRAAGDPESARGVLDFAGVNSKRWIGSNAAPPRPSPRPSKPPAKRGPRRQDFQAPSSDAEVIPDDDLEIY